MGSPQALCAGVQSSLKSKGAGPSNSTRQECHSSLAGGGGLWGVAVQLL